MPKKPKLPKLPFDKLNPDVSYHAAADHHGIPQQYRKPIGDKIKSSSKP